MSDVLSKEQVRKILNQRDPGCCDQGRDILELCDSHEALRAELATVERELRTEWWLGHGCGTGPLYGDDGEMQCNALTCMRDFKRDQMDALREHVHARRLARVAEALAARDTARAEGGDQ